MAFENGSAGWPASNGFASIYLADLHADNSLAANWALATEAVAHHPGTHIYDNRDLGSPGALTSPVPEPGTLALLGIGCLGLACRRRIP